MDGQRRRGLRAGDPGGAGTGAEDVVALTFDSVVASDGCRVGDTFAAWVSKVDESLARQADRRPGDACAGLVAPATHADVGVLLRLRDPALPVTEEADGVGVTRPPELDLTCLLIVDIDETGEGRLTAHFDAGSSDTCRRSARRWPRVVAT